MRIAIPVLANDPLSTVSLKFARSKFFALIDTDNGVQEFISNPFSAQKNQVGKQVFNLLTNEHKIQTFIAFELGLKVQQMALKHKIQLIIISEKKKTLSDLIDSLMQHKNEQA